MEIVMKKKPVVEYINHVGGSIKLGQSVILEGIYNHPRFYDGYPSIITSPVTRVCKDGFYTLNTHYVRRQQWDTCW